LASPLLPLPSIAVDAMKLVVMVVPQLKFDGASAVVGDTSFVFISPRFAPRMLFTLAHEICHIIAHHKPGEDFAIADEEERTGSFKHKDPREAFADYFASCLLLPKAGVGIALKQIRRAHSGKDGPLGDIDILYLSHIFGVSFLAAAIRCESLGLLLKGGAFSIYKELCEKHGSPEVRARELELPERPKVDFPGLPTRLLEDVIEKIKQGQISIGKASSLLNIPIAELLRAHRGIDS
jgi:Zn-dependent peptidase ImmA (M78 family)